MDSHHNVKFREACCGQRAWTNLVDSETRWVGGEGWGGGGGRDPVDVHTLIFHHYLVACGTTGFRVGGQAIPHTRVSMEPPT